MPLSNIIRWSRRTFSVEVEYLELRRLLSGAGVYSPEFAATEQLTPGARLTLGIVPVILSSDAASSVTDESAAAGVGPTDAYVLPAGDGLPEVSIELRWGSGPDPADGQLVVLDASGSPLYKISLDNLVSLQTSVTIPTSPGTFLGGPTLNIDLTIERGDGIPGAAGSYHLIVTWQPLEDLNPPAETTAPASAQELPPSTSPTSSPPQNSDPTPPVAPPSLTVVGLVPLPSITGNSGTAIGTSSPPATNPAGGSGPIAVLEPPSGTAPPPVVILAPAGLAAGRTPTIPIALTPSLLGPSSMGFDQGAATFVGPLPLGVSTPDGGIFALAFQMNSPVTAASTFRTGPTIEVKTIGVLTDPTSIEPAATEQVSIRSAGRAREFATPVDWQLNIRSWTGPRSDEAEHDALVGQAAFLPVLGTLAAAVRPVKPVQPGPARPRDNRRGWINPVVVVLAVLTTSTVLVMKLSAANRLRERQSWPIHPLT